MYPWFCVLLVWIAGRAAPVLAVVGGSPAVAPEPDAAVVFIHKHDRSARVEGLKDNRLGYYSFFGIRYAEPPVGPRRFQRPERRLLSGELNATSHCLPCPQQHPHQRGKVMGHEDCLCLNIYAPKMPGEEHGSPVVFFIHGGNYKSGSSAAYGGQHLVQKDTILVSAQYRLGSLGYFSTAQREASGNAGLFDLQSALSWVSDYIDFFGGDPKRVVVMGQGSGGSAASLLALSSQRQGRSPGVVALSGTPLSPGAVKQNQSKYAQELANKTGCPEKPPERLVKCLRTMAMEKIVLADATITGDMLDTKTFLDEISGRSGNGARVEGKEDQRGLPPVVSEEPAESLKNKQQSSPLLTGVNSAETSRAVYGKYSGFLKEQLKAIKDFIKKDLIGGLQNVVNDVDGLIPLPTAQLGQVIPVQDYYQSLFDNSVNAEDGLSQIAEATGDALFNFPAYQTIQAWSEASPAYLYSFDHVGNLTKGSHFLPGLPITEESNQTESEVVKDSLGPAHGDELAYIFEPLDEGGIPVGEDVSGVDARVRDNFVTLISKFAHDINMEEYNKSKSLNFKPYSKSNEEFIKIKDDISVDKNFRFCQMGLWGNMADRITGALCNNLFGHLLKLNKLPLNLPPKLDALGMLNNNDKKKTTVLTKSVTQVTGQPVTNPPKRRGGLGSIINIG